MRWLPTRSALVTKPRKQRAYIEEERRSLASPFLFADISEGSGTEPGRSPLR
jgi:hypothetical protein